MTNETFVTKVMKAWCVYAISSTSAKKSYVGATTNHVRRLRQHNSEIKGGAKYTRGVTDWQFIFRVDGFVNTQALKFEWSLKHPSPTSATTSPSLDAADVTADVTAESIARPRKKRKRPRRASGRGVTGRVANLERVLLLDKWRELPLVVTWCIERPSTFTPPPWIEEQDEVEVFDSTFEGTKVQ